MSKMTDLTKRSEISLIEGGESQYLLFALPTVQMNGCYHCHLAME